ncbi:NAD-dependent epimerase/dehydratase family protein [Aestuariispira insulae]|uniref:Nucleoside-diphosphate-sugar epimerase n=1 Tax=Aestuariispira insulae TaxID=1461337 RepID=A0A3D9HPI7_9PROT|nr:NAD(P)-dependent oxidoreductase [Aestuariispira insulae]RED50816.1 nucleoside-diphosphate-sugar epimerase [Aestuariispira insulae]
MGRILVTGGSGIVGRHAVNALASQGHDLHLISRHPVQNPDHETHQADILDIPAMEQLLKAVRPESILHLAWETEHGEYWHSPNNLNHVAASLHLAKQFRELGGGRFVAAGTCAEYSWAEKDLSAPLDEKTALCHPHTLYGQSKLSTFRLLGKYAETSGLSFAWGRLFLLYGPGEQARRLCPDVILNLTNNQPVKCSSGKQIRDFMHTEDAGRAFAALLDSDVQGPVNMATGSALPLSGFVQELAEQLGRPDLVKLGALPDRPDDPKQLIAKTDRLKHEVGYHPVHTLESGLRDTIAWWRANRSEKN